MRSAFLLTRSWRSPLSYKNQTIDLGSKSIGWFLYDNGLRHERVKPRFLQIRFFENLVSYLSVLVILLMLSFTALSDNSTKAGLGCVESTLVIFKALLKRLRLQALILHFPVRVTCPKCSNWSTRHRRSILEEFFFSLLLYELMSLFLNSMELALHQPVYFYMKYSSCCIMRKLQM